MVEFRGYFLALNGLNMQRTVTKKHTGNELLKNYLATHKVKIAYSSEELLGPETGETQEQLQAEVY